MLSAQEEKQNEMVPFDRGHAEERCLTLSQDAKSMFQRKKDAVPHSARAAKAPEHV